LDTSTRSWLEIFSEIEPDMPEPAATDEPDDDLSLAASVLHPDDGDLPILSSLVGSMRWSGSAPPVGDSWDAPDRIAGVAPMPMPLESLQSLPVASRML
jgi:hypothetical protein